MSVRDSIFLSLFLCLFTACQEGGQEKGKNKADNVISSKDEVKEKAVATTVDNEGGFGFWLKEKEYPKLRPDFTKQIKSDNQFALENMPFVKNTNLPHHLLDAFRKNDFQLFKSLCYAAPEEMQQVFVKNGSYEQKYIEDHTINRQEEARKGFKNIQDLWSLNNWSRNDMKLAYTQYVFDDIADGTPFFTLHIYFYLAHEKKLIKMTYADCFCFENGECRLTRAMERGNFYTMQEGGIITK